MNEAYLNGNLIREYDKSQLGDEPDALFAVDILAAAENNNPVYGVEGAWGYGYEKKDSNSFGDANFERIYEWDDKNQLIKTKDGLYTTYYVYNNEGDRVAKYTERSETLYFNKFWSWHIDPANAFAGGQLSKHIFLGDTRIVTKLSQETNNYIDAEKQRLYFYHSDHLGSARLITDYKGNEYERLEYTPYGELWVDLSEYTGSTYLPFKFSAKEMDSETGLYYYGARYLDSKYSLWKSTDPALGEYIPKAPVNEQAKQYNQNLPGMGGIFNPINANLYHYAGNNPVRYVDPDGREDKNSRIEKNKDILIVISIDNKNKSGLHAMLMYRDKIAPSKNFMIDASGSYAESWGRTKNSALLENTENTPVTLRDCIRYFEGEVDATLYIYQLTGTPNIIKKLKQEMESIEQQFFIVACALTASKALENSGLFKDFKQTWFPKVIKEYFDEWLEKNKNTDAIKITLIKFNLMNPPKKFNYRDYDVYN